MTDAFVDKGYRGHDDKGKATFIWLAAVRET